MKKHVLILEDNAMLSEALEKAIREYDGEITVHRAETYETACVAALTYKIQLFILDIILSTEDQSDTSGFNLQTAFVSAKNIVLPRLFLLPFYRIPKCIPLNSSIVTGILKSPFP